MDASFVNNSITTSVMVVSHSRHLLISDAIMVYFNISFTIVVHGFVSLTGVFSNLINMIVFAKLGMKDSISIGLLSLSLTDFLVCGSQLARCSCTIMEILELESSSVDMALVSVILSWLKHMAYLISAWITVVISVERCFCVVFPFKVRQIFTRARCVLVVMGIYVFFLGLHMPIFLTQRADSVSVTSNLPGPESEQSSNRSENELESSDNGAEIEITVDMLGLFLSVLSQVIVLVCAVWMIHVLRMSSQVRPTMGHPVSQIGQPQTLTKPTKSLKENEVKLSDKERRLIKIVLFLAILLTVSNVPKFAGTIAYHVVPELYNWTYRNTMYIIVEVSHFFNTFSCAINVVVYYKLNSNYKNVILGLILCGEKLK